MNMKNANNVNKGLQNKTDYFGEILFKLQNKYSLYYTEQCHNQLKLYINEGDDQGVPFSLKLIKSIRPKNMSL